MKLCLLLLAAKLLLMLPFAPPDWVLDLPGVWPAVRRVAWDEDVLAPDMIWVGRYDEDDGGAERWSEDKGYTLQHLRTERLRVADFPHSWWLQAFPCRDELSDQLIFNWSYEEYCRGQAELWSSYPDEQERWLRIAEEAKTAREPWSWVHKARCSEGNLGLIRDYLNDVKGRIGEQAFYSGRLPPPVPLKYFREVPW